MPHVALALSHRSFALPLIQEGSNSLHTEGLCS